MEIFRRLPRWTPCVWHRVCISSTSFMLLSSQQPLRKFPQSFSHFSSSQASESTVRKVRKTMARNSKLPDNSFGFGVPLTTGQQTKKRSDRNATQPKESGFFNVSAYGISQMIDLNALRTELTRMDHSYNLVNLPPDLSVEVLLLSGKQMSNQNSQVDLFIFRSGVIVFWNLPESEHHVFLSRIRKYCREAVDPARIEREDLRYCFADGRTRLVGEDIYLQSHECRTSTQQLDSDETAEQLSEMVTPKQAVDQTIQHHDHERQLQLAKVDDPIRMEQFAFSEALALSVKLALLENSFDSVAVQMEPWIEKMKNGLGFDFSQSSVLKKTGELFTLRHLLNISTSMIEIPDFYWDRPEVESLYIQLRAALSVPTRTRVLNSRLNMCCELTEILSNHLQSRHASRLEWMIIVLILVEVAFEAFYLYERRQARKLPSKLT